jgi:hypothetical protein
MSPTALEASRQFMAAANRSTTLYDLSADYLEVLNLLEDAPDDLALEQELDHLAGQITHKAEAIAGLVAHYEGLASVRKAEAKRLTDRAEADKHRADRLRAYVLQHMQALGSERIETARFTLSVRTNPPSVQVLEEMMIPAEFIKTVTTTSVDKRAILEQLKTTGEVVPGVEITRGQRLEIR